MAEPSEISIEISHICSIYTTRLEELGAHPDKVLINALTMLASDISPFCPAQIYKTIKARLLSPHTDPSFKLPLMYLIDSILNNVGGRFIDEVGATITSVLLSVYNSVSGSDKEKIRKVVIFWEKRAVFTPEKIQKLKNYWPASFWVEAMPAFALHDIPGGLVAVMESMLVEMQVGMDEENPVSLTQLSVMNPELVRQIYDAALDQENDDSGDSYNNSGMHEDSDNYVPTFNELWSKESQTFMVSTSQSSALLKILDSNILKAAGDIADLSSPEEQASVFNMLIGAQAASEQLRLLLIESVSGGGSSAAAGTGLEQYAAQISMSEVDESMFTNEGVKEKNASVIYSMYNGFSFACKEDGRRFRTQIELQRHLDRRFRLREVEKKLGCMTLSGWFVSEDDFIRRVVEERWPGEEEKKDDDVADDDENLKNTLEADESRSSCSICGKAFETHYDDEEGRYLYMSAKEVVVEEENGMETDDVYVHISCAEALGCTKGMPILRSHVL